MVTLEGLDCVIGVRSSLRDALASIDRSGAGVVVIAAADQRVVGLLTDGDLRRAILGGASLSDGVEPHMKRSFTSVAPAASRSDVLDLMQARCISEVPILDDAGRLVGLHRMHDVIAAHQLPNWAVVMAGGRGLRLAPLTDTVPKPMLRVAGRPILERIVLHLVGAGISRIFLSINYLGHIVEEHFGDGSRFGCRIDYLREEVPLGTGGALALLPEQPSDPLLVLNGDLVTQTDFGALTSAHESSGGAMTVGVRRYFHTVPFGCLDVRDEQVVGIEEKPTLTRVINAGIYAVGPDLLPLIPRGAPYNMPTLVTDAIARGHRVIAHEIEEDWIDVGQQDQLRRARGES